MRMVLCILLISYGGNELTLHRTLYQWFWRRKRRLLLLPIILWYPIWLIVSIIPIQAYRPYCHKNLLFSQIKTAEFSPILTKQYIDSLTFALKNMKIVHIELNNKIYIPYSILWINDGELSLIHDNAVLSASSDARNSPNNSKVKELFEIYSYHQWHNPDSTSEDVSNSWCQLVESVTTQPDAYLETP